MAIAPFIIETVEGHTKTYSTTILDEADVAVPDAAFTAIRMTFYSISSGTIVNSRNNQSVLNANNCTIDANGLFTWKIQEVDVIIVESPKPPAVVHRAVLVFEWNDAQAVARQAVREIDITIQRADNVPLDAP